MPPPGPDPRSTHLTFLFISISKCPRFRPQPVHGLQPQLNPNALLNSLTCFWSTTVLGRIIATKDVHVLIPETWNMLFDMAKGTSQVWLSLGTRDGEVILNYSAGQSDHKGPNKKEAGGPEPEKEM